MSIFYEKAEVDRMSNVFLRGKNIFKICLVCLVESSGGGNWDLPHLFSIFFSYD